MDTAARVKRFIAPLRQNKIFTTRHLLHLGTRAAIDSVLQRLVRRSELVRLARGVFAKSGINIAEVSVDEIARIKAAAFGKRLISHPQDAAKRLGLSTKGNRTATYATDGSSSSFRFFGEKEVRIRFMRIGRRKFRLGNTKVGDAIRGLWHIGRKLASRPQALMAATHAFGRRERKEFRESARWMPWWLSDFVYRWHHQRHQKSLSGRAESAYG